MLLNTRVHTARANVPRAVIDTDILTYRSSGLNFELSVFRYNSLVSVDAVGLLVKVWHTTGNKTLQQAYPFLVILIKQI